MRRVAIVLFLILSAIAALHVFWGFGGRWPGATTKELIDTVIGVPEMRVMPAAGITFAIAGLIFLGGVIALFAGGLLPFRSRWMVQAATGVLTLVFLGRATAGFWIAYHGSKASEPFATNDVLLYSPLCLVIGGAFAALFIFYARKYKTTP
ncbi:MAG: DUF3995 domain-containing protein [Micropepsaceae bacterium]